ncbi:hypothetical protein GCM10010932_00310 [Agromyces flavus]|nr:hypothetical protein GCM10010932_00310 [Agromyces flavus]
MLCATPPAYWPGRTPRWESGASAVLATARFAGVARSGRLSDGSSRGAIQANSPRAETQQG